MQSTKPDVVQFMLGTNDVNIGKRDANTILEAYTSILGSLRAANPKVSVIVSSLAEFLVKSIRLSDTSFRRRTRSTSSFPRAGATRLLRRLIPPSRAGQRSTTRRVLYRGCRLLSRRRHDQRHVAGRPRPSQRPRRQVHLPSSLVRFWFR